ncbi:hypothetical protein D3C71_2079410 [compost metagenome]
MIRAIQIFDSKQEELIYQLEAGLPVSDYKKHVATLIKLRDKDFEIAQSRESIVAAQLS